MWLYKSKYFSVSDRIETLERVDSEKTLTDSLDAPDLGASKPKRCKLNMKRKSYGVNVRETALQLQEKQREFTNLEIHKAFNKVGIPIILKSS